MKWRIKATLIVKADTPAAATAAAHAAMRYAAQHSVDAVEQCTSERDLASDLHEDR